MKTQIKYDDTNRGVLFKNDKKTSDNHPDYKGNGNFDGADVWISAWIKTSKGGDKFMSLSFTARDDQRPKSRTPPEKEDDDDDVPF